MGENGNGNSAFLKCRILRILTLEAHEREHDNDDAINFVYICQLSAMILMQRSNQNNAPDSPSSSCAKSFSFNITAFQIDCYRFKIPQCFKLTQESLMSQTLWLIA